METEVIKHWREQVEQHLTVFFNFQGKHGLQFIFSGSPRFRVHLHTVANTSLRAMAECLQQSLGVKYKNSQAEKTFTETQIHQSFCIQGWNRGIKNEANPSSTPHAPVNRRQLSIQL